MADTQGQVNPPLLENILAQPRALELVAAHHRGEGRAAMSESAEILLSKKRIVLTGMGASLFACIPLRYMLAGRGLDVSVIETAELLHFLAPALTAETAIVLVSRSGESIEVLKLLDRVARLDCATVGIVNVPGSILASRADRAIVISSPPDQLVAIQTYTGTLATLALLGAACFGEYDGAVSELESIGAPLSHHISRCQEASRQWFVQPPARNMPIYLLARGPALASIEAGVLLMHEVAKTAAVGMSIAQFRHGPVETVDEHFRAIVIGTQRATSEMDLQLAGDLARMGGEVRWLGPLPRSSTVAALSEWPETVPDRFACTFEAVPLQLLAYRMAERNGITPGEFRWAGAVTTSETGFAGLTGS
jgi:glucosamine--fructose-6-phosphate aminotransferase (isomerizing)